MKYLMNALSFTFACEPALRFVRPIEANYSVSGLPGSVRISSPHPVMTKDLYWVMSTEISVDIAVDIAVDSRSIVGRQSVDSRSIVGR